MPVKTFSIEETKQIAADFMATLAPGEKTATIVALSGELGSGKTAFVKCVAESIGIKEEITSPTFVIEKIYSIRGAEDTASLSNKNRRFKRMIHIDAYRLDSGRDLTKLNWDHIVADKDNLIFIEWPENVAEIIPANAKRISFKFVDEKTREIIF